MQYTYSVYNMLEGETEAHNINMPPNVFAVQTLIDLYNRLSLVEGDSAMTNDHFEFFGGVVGEDSICTTIGIEMVRLTRYMPSTQLVVTDDPNAAGELRWSMIDLLS